MNVHSVTLELLRAGPPHNQLLSPLTQYLGVCGESGAEVVHVPYEHYKFDRRLKELRYEDGTDEDFARRLEILGATGEDMGEVLAGVPGLPGALRASQDGTMTHLRLVISATELAMLPFELAKAPRGAEMPRDSWLLLQRHAPVCLTRHVRSVPTAGVCWPAQPRILFVAGDPGDIPFDAHREALEAAVAPWGGGGSMLTVVENATLKSIQHAFAAGCDGQPFTHLHVLAHGAEDENATGPSGFGLALTDEDGFPDVVSGERLATALARQGDRGPTVVTLATCDSANQKDAVNAPLGASLAHALHAAGVPFVVASQFPLSKEGSVLLVRRLYRELMWGTHPLQVICEIRGALHSRLTNHSHDWASVVVYEALPAAAELARQLEELVYQQTKRALDAGLKALEATVPEDDVTIPSDETLAAHRARIGAALARLPTVGPYKLECQGLHAAAAKRQAEVAFRLAKRTSGGEAEAHFTACFEALEDAHEDYKEAMIGFLVYPDEDTQRKASLHWLLMQHLTLAAVLGRPMAEEGLMTVKLVAEHYLDRSEDDERAWAHGSLAEMWLLRLTQAKLPAARRAEAADRAQLHVAAILTLFPRPGSFPVFATRRQLQRYVDWWGDPVFARRLKARGGIRPRRWTGEGGVVATAQTMIDILDRKRVYS